MVFLYLDRMCQCALYAVLWSHIGTLMLNLAVPQDFNFPLSVPVEWSCWQCIRWCGTGWYLEQGQCFLLTLAALSLDSSTIFPFLFFLSICWYCEAGVFRLIGCKSLFHSLALATSFNNNYNNWPDAATYWPDLGYVWTNFPLYIFCCKLRTEYC